MTQKCLTEGSLASPAKLDLDAQPMIEAKNLVKTYSNTKRNGSGKPAVNNVSFEVPKASLFVIMGLSGSGKSTLLRMLNRLIDPSSGESFIDGENLVTMNAPRLRKIRNTKMAMVFQHFAIFPHRTILYNAAYGLKIRGDGKASREQAAMETLKTVGLEEWAHRYPSDLSGGMRQRVGLARALATDAEILLMDEPFSALDPLIKKEMQELLVNLQKKLNKTIIFVTHDLNEAMRIGDKIMVMRDGQVAQIGTADEILGKPRDEYIAKFVEDVDRGRVLTAQSVALPPSVTANLQDPPREVLERINRCSVQATYVVDDEGRVAGVATRDSLEASACDDLSRLQDFICDEFEVVPIDAKLNDFYAAAGKHEVPIGITDRSGRLVGVAPRAHIMNIMSGTRDKGSACLT